MQRLKGKLMLQFDHQQKLDNVDFLGFYKTKTEPYIKEIPYLQ